MRWSFHTPEAKGVCVGPARRMSSWERSSVEDELGGKR